MGWLGLGLVLVMVLGLVWMLPVEPVWAASGGISGSGGVGSNGSNGTSGAAIARLERVPLTLPLLQERLKSPMKLEGARVIDLRRTVIDLRPENSAFREQFYRLLRGQLRSQTPPGIDLSYSEILGEFQIGELGLAASLYGQPLLPLLGETEQAQLARDRRRLAQLSQLSRSLLIQSQPVALQLSVFPGPLTLVQTRFDGFANFSNTFFMGRVEAQGAIFGQTVDWSEARFSKAVNLSGAGFRGEARFRNAIFFKRAQFSQGQFQGDANFQASEFRDTANFSQSVFQQRANFSRVQWLGPADFAQTRWQGRAMFDRSSFGRSLFFTEAVFETRMSFRQAQFNQPVNLRGATVLEQLDFGDASFAAKTYVNVATLQFNAEKAKILGNPGQLGRVLSVPALQGNETTLRSLIRNFRLLEQIPDVNQIEYLREKLRLQELRQQLFGTNLNTASPARLVQVGFSSSQAEAIAQARGQQPFRSLPDLLKLSGIDLATYVKVQHRVVAGNPQGILGTLGNALNGLGLVLLLSLSRYGTNVWLILGVGMVALSYFALLFWFIDRVRRLHPTPILPRLTETVAMLGGAGTLGLAGLSAILRTAETPWLTLLYLGLLAIPIPLAMLIVIYRRGRFHDLMEVSYFVEDGSLRQLRLLIGRLPNIPNFPFFRDRYTPIPWDRGWNWLNYLDFSLNNLLKFGFNDIRLRDQHVPGLITALAWYQWSLGLIYFALLLWTLSRTIPGLNLLIYFK
ncbi:MAG TPA: pentapeptide repeat-containing protein [Chroococcidiopsis sp.]